MKLTIPQQMVTACDFCEKPSNYLRTCLVCGKEYCVICEPAIPGCIVSVKVCPDCAKKQHVLDIIKEHAARMSSILLDRDNQLKQLGVTNEQNASASADSD